MDILFIGKKGDTNAQLAAQYLKQIFPSTFIQWSDRSEKLPTALFEWSGDYIFSYLAQWVLPDALLKRAKIAAINWHPGPPNYPGIGCTNFAIYNAEKEFGITCHKMLGKVDSGAIMEVLRFRVLENDSVFSITQKCYSLILQSFFRIIELIATNQPLPQSNEIWTRKPYTRKELNALCEIQFDMSNDEIEKRIKATSYDRPWAFIEVKGKKFFFKAD